MSEESKASPHHERPDPPPSDRTKSDAQPVSSLNQAIRLELGYLDTALATPFRAVRRSLSSRKQNPLSSSLDELVWAMEGMTRLPLKFLKAAFGDEMTSARPERKGS